MRIFFPVPLDNGRVLQGFLSPPHHSPQLWKTCCRSLTRSGFPRLFGPGSPVDNDRRTVRLYCASRPLAGIFPTPFEPRETDLPAERAQAEAEARLPRADGDACGPA